MIFTPNWGNMESEKLKPTKFGDACSFAAREHFVSVSGSCYWFYKVKLHVHRQSPWSLTDRLARK